jgi:hypothetical protein
MSIVHEKVLRNREHKKVLVCFGKTNPATKEMHDAYIVVSNNKVIKNHAPTEFPFAEGEIVDKLSIKEFFDDSKEKKNAEGIIELNDVTKKKILSELRATFVSRYGTKLNDDMNAYVPKRKSYKLEDCMSDLEFVLNHLNVK